MTKNNPSMRLVRSNTHYSHDVANLLYRNSFGGIVVSLIVSSLLVFGFSNNTINTNKRIWFAVMALCLLLRLTDATIWRKRLMLECSDATRAIRRFVIGCIVTAFLWAVYAVVFVKQMDLLELTTTVIVVSAMAGGAPTVLAAHKLTAIAYALILLVPLSICGLLSEHDDRQVFGALGMVFAAIMASSANKASNFTMRAIHLKHDNAELLVQMEIEKQIVKDANSSLEEKIKQRTREIYELSYIDPLTGLSNRKAFSIQLSNLLAECKAKTQTLALLFIDLDGFKAINDSRGHKIGDLVLQEASSRISEFSKNQRNICRWGGDEFLLALPHVDQEGALGIAREIIEHLARSIETGHESLSVGATIGIALFPHHGDNEDQLIRVADSAMYLQKKSAKSEARVFSQYMMDMLDRQQYLRDGLAHAISKNELYLTYQPIVDSVTREVVSYEALLRWKIDEELILPEEFIPVAEQFGFIKEIGRWVLEQACIDASAWCSINNIGVSVNVSIIQLLEGGFDGLVKQTITSTGLNAQRLFIEVTESVFAEDKQQLREFLSAVQDLGVNVSIDDFGTGYSSLSLLQILGVNLVKIDQIFIQKINTGGASIVQAALHIGQSLNYKVVAEGVETAEQAKILQEMGIHYLQGFYFSKPIRQDRVMAHYADNGL